MLEINCSIVLASWALRACFVCHDSTLHSRLLSDQSQLKEDMDTLKRKNTQLVREHNHLQQSCEEMKRLHDEDQKEITDLRSQQQQVSHSLSGCAGRSWLLPSTGKSERAVLLPLASYWFPNSLLTSYTIRGNNDSLITD